MKKLIGLLLVLALLFGCAGAEGAAPALSKDLVILYTADVHCGVDQGWGYAGLYAVKESLSKSNYLLLVDDGDAIQGEPIGTMTAGEAIIGIMNTVGYDIAIPGNHEFDYGVDRFLALTEKADFPYICCNFNKEGEPVFRPYIIREFDGVKFAFVGVLTPMTLRDSTPRNFMNEQGEFIYGFLQDETGEALYSAVQKAVDDARAEGADYVIVLGHLGNAAESFPWMYSDVIANTTGIDAWLDGHSHDSEQVIVKNKDGADVVRSACGTKMANIGVLTITKDGRISSELYGWGSSVAAPELLGLENPGNDAVHAAKDVLDEKLKEVVAKTSVTLYIYDPEAKTAEGKPVRIVRRAETNLGDLCADAFRDQSGGADIAFINSGSVRVQLEKGEITRKDILSVCPFGNSLTVIEATGQQILDALEWSVHSLPGEFGGFEQVSGIAFEVDPEIESPVLEDENMMFAGVDGAKERRVRNVLVGGEPLDPEKTYTLASTEYHLLNNGDGYTMFGGCKVLQEAVKLDNQVLIDYITGTLGGVISDNYGEPYGDGRIVSVHAAQ